MSEWRTYLISKLGGGSNNLRVLPTGSIHLGYSEEDLSNLAGIGRELGVNSVLTGTIQREGKDIRVTAQLYDVKDSVRCGRENSTRNFQIYFRCEIQFPNRLPRTPENFKTPISRCPMKITRKMSRLIKPIRWDFFIGTNKPKTV